MLPLKRAATLLFVTVPCLEEGSRASVPRIPGDLLVVSLGNIRSGCRDSGFSCGGLAFQGLEFEMGRKRGWKHGHCEILHGIATHDVCFTIFLRRSKDVI